MEPADSLVSEGSKRSFDNKMKSFDNLNQGDTKDNPESILKNAPDENSKHVVLENNNKMTTTSSTRPRKHFYDGIRKKVKSHFHKYLLRKTNQMINAFYPKLKILKWQNKFTSDITIQTNKDLLKKSMKEILSFENSTNSNKSSLHNKQVLEKIIADTRFKDFLESSYEDQYVRYWMSSDFQKDLEEIKKKENNDVYVERYIFLAANYISYFLDMKPNQKKIQKTEEKPLVSD